MIKVRTFPGATIQVMKFFVVPHLKKKPDNIIIHVGTNNAPHSSPYEMFQEMQSLRNFILKYLPSARITISTPVLRIDKANANDINKTFTELVKESNLDYISHENINESHINEYSLNINRTGSSILAKNLISGIRNFWCFLDSKKEVNIDGSCLNNIRFYDNLRPGSETISMNSIPEKHQDDIILGLKNLRVKYFNKIIMGHLNINSIRNNLNCFHNS